MARYKRVFTEEKMKKWLKEGRGTGHLEKYKPWYKTRDVSSKGLRTRIWGNLTHRTHHLLSRREYWLFHIVEFSSNVADIREQFPLPRGDTQEIAQRLGIRHPVDPQSKVPIVMTTDFLIDVTRQGKTVLIARTVKPQNKLNRRTVEKFEIERTYWQERNVDWGIVTEEEIPLIAAKNIKWFRPSYYLEHIPKATLSRIDEYELMLYNLFDHREYTLRSIAAEMERQNKLQADISLTLMQHFLARHIWLADLSVCLWKSKVVIKRKSDSLQAVG